MKRATVLNKERMVKNAGLIHCSQKESESGPKDRPYWIFCT